METHGSVMLPVALGAADDLQTFLVNYFIVELMLPYKTILKLGGREACHGGTITTVLITSSRTGIKVRCSDVSLGTTTRAPVAFSS
jgi:hypothetical protein